MPNKPPQCEKLKNKMVEGIKKISVLDDLRAFLANGIEFLGKIPSENPIDVISEGQERIKSLDLMRDNAQTKFETDSLDYWNECITPMELKEKSSEQCNTKMDDIILIFNQLDTLIEEDKERKESNKDPMNLISIMKLDHHVHQMVQEYSDICPSELKSTVNNVDQATHFRDILDTLNDEMNRRGFAYDEEMKKLHEKYDVPDKESGMFI